MTLQELAERLRQAADALPDALTKMLPLPEAVLMGSVLNVALLVAAGFLCLYLRGHTPRPTTSMQGSRRSDDFWQYLIAFYVIFSAQYVLRMLPPSLGGGAGRELGDYLKETLYLFTDVPLPILLCLAALSISRTAPNHNAARPNVGRRVRSLTHFGFVLGTATALTAAGLATMPFPGMSPDDRVGVAMTLQPISMVAAIWTCALALAGESERALPGSRLYRYVLPCCVAAYGCVQLLGVLMALAPEDDSRGFEVCGITFGFFGKLALVYSMPVISQARAIDQLAHLPSYDLNAEHRRHLHPFAVAAADLVRTRMLAAVDRLFHGLGRIDLSARVVAVLDKERLGAIDYNHLLPVLGVARAVRLNRRLAYRRQLDDAAARAGTPHETEMWDLSAEISEEIDSVEKLSPDDLESINGKNNADSLRELQLSEAETGPYFARSVPTPALIELTVAERDAFRFCLAELLDNVVRYASAETRPRVALTECDTEVILEVTNSVLPNKLDERETESRTKAFGLRSAIELCASMGWTCELPYFDRAGSTCYVRLTIPRRSRA